MEDVIDLVVLYTHTFTMDTVVIVSFDIVDSNSACANLNALLFVCLFQQYLERHSVECVPPPRANSPL